MKHKGILSMEKRLSIKEKSVKVNIDSNYFGTIAEIGGGQETARNLFQAGGASNTVAKSISAYDKQFSDYFYNEGNAARYVAKGRLEKMLKCEYDQLKHVIKGANQEQKSFVFANTVETLNFHKTNLGHGWLGVCYEDENAQENSILIHVKLKENDGLLQQYTLGALGINLIYGVMFLNHKPKDILSSLLDNLDVDRVEVDFVALSGPKHNAVDNRILNLFLVSSGMTPAVMFDSNGTVQQPADMLYKKNVFAIRGHFRPLNNLGVDIINDSLEIFKHDEDYQDGNTVTFCEISLSYLRHHKDAGYDETEFLNRVELLNAVGQCVMVSNIKRYFRLVEYFDQFKLKKLRFVMGSPTFAKVLDDDYYTDLRGGLLEAMGRFFIENMKLYIYPSVNRTNEVVFSEDIPLTEQARHLLAYLESTDKILKMKGSTNRYHTITNRKVDELIRQGADELKAYVPESIYTIIKEKHLFGYPE